jgi:molecular chaperone DnaK
VLDTADAETLKSKTESLAQLSMKLGEAMYQSQADASGGGDEGGDSAGGSGGAGDENVVDADFEEVDDDKKKSA